MIDRQTDRQTEPINAASFRILKLSEEEKLNQSEKESYYAQFREYVRKRKLTNTTNGATLWGPKLKNATNKIAAVLNKSLCAKNAEFVTDGLANVPDGPVLFAQTHQGLLDNFAWIPSCPKHCIIFHANTVRKALIVIQMNTGLVMVDKEDKENRMGSKLDTIRLLLDGHSVMIFPESTWLLSPNKLHLTMNYGFLDIARKAGVPVIPIACEYEYRTNSEKDTAITKVHIRYCKPIYVGISDNLNDKLEEFSAAISTARFNMMEEKGVFHRPDISNFDYIYYLKSNLKALNLAKIPIDGERKNMWDYSNDFYRFHHINDYRFSDDGTLLETEEAENLNQLLLSHGIRYQA